MTAEEFKEAQYRLGLTNEQTVALLRVSIRTVEKWRQGVRGEIPGPVVVVFALLEHYRARRRDHERRAVAILQSLTFLMPPGHRKPTRAGVLWRRANQCGAASA